MSLSAFAAPIVLGAAAWCALGHLTVASFDSANVRLLVPAPWWTFVAAVIVAAAIPPIRRAWLASLPALLTILPWLPVPLPAIALVWTGPLAWVPVVAAVAAACGSAWLGRVGDRLLPRTGGRAMAIAAAVTFLMAAYGAHLYAPMLPDGDEPHYLLITQSLIRDHDLKIENNYQQRDYLTYYNGDLPAHDRHRALNGGLYSQHAPGIAFLLVPAFALAGYPGAVLWLMLIAAATSALIWRAGFEATDDARAAWFAWAAVALSAAFVLHSFRVFAELPGAFVVSCSVVLLLRLARGRHPRLGTVVVVALLIAALPWLHTRFAILGAGLGAAIALAMVLDETRPRGQRLMRAAIFLAIPALSAIGWFAFFQVLYGSPSPSGPWGPISSNEMSARWIPGGVLGVLFDEQFGLIAYTPILIVAFAGWRRASEKPMRRAMAATLIVAAAYIVSVGAWRMFWAGAPASPARFLVVVLPILAAPVAAVWARAAAMTRRALLVLLAASLALTTLVLTVDHGALAWNGRDAQAGWLAWLGPVVNLRRGWPSFFFSDARFDQAATPTASVLGAHVLIWIVVFAAGWILARETARRVARSAGTERVWVAIWALGAVMLAVAGGWRLEGARALDPAASQLDVFAHAGAGAEVTRVGPWTIDRHVPVSQAMVVHSEEPGVDDPRPPLLVVSDAPAGKYLVHTAAGSAARFVVKVGRTTIARVPGEAPGMDAAAFVLPTAVASLIVDADAADAPRAEIALIPQDAAAPSARFANRATRYPASSGSTLVFFEDRFSYPDPGGFWVAGGATTHLTIVAEGHAVLALALRNGASANEVTLDLSSGRQTLSLRPNEERVVPIPIDGGGMARIAATSSSGFKPSEVFASFDRRYLGVWITPR